mgnify:CR=1 FL=1
MLSDAWESWNTSAGEINPGTPIAKLADISAANQKLENGLWRLARYEQNLNLPLHYRNASTLLPFLKREYKM